ncbi:hypothetical protein [Thermogemmatispora sp.]|uniref:hypothetical protein n=1 Tax=Thermogemmatispora sp. TaxID=1968838 RepID=UPI0035E45A89
MAGLANLMRALLRLLWFLLSTRVGNLVAACGLLVGGLIWGLTSHQVHYEAAPPITSFVVYSSQEEGYDYVRINGGILFFIIRESDFSPYPGRVFEQMQPSLRSLVYESDSPQAVELDLDNGQHVSGSGYPVVAFTVVTETGQVSAFTTAGYRAHPHGFYDDHWRLATWLLLAGLAFLIWVVLGPLVLDLWRLRRSLEPGYESFSTRRAYRLLGRPLRNSWWGPKRPREIDPRDLTR